MVFLDDLNPDAKLTNVHNPFTAVLGILSVILGHSAVPVRIWTPAPVAFGLVALRFTRPSEFVGNFLL